MKKEYNSEAFTPEEVKKGLHLKLLNTLLELSSEMDKRYNDIHIWTDGYCTIIDWCQAYYENRGEGKFEFVDADEYIVMERCFPDNHYETFGSEEEYEERLKDWLAENPGWVKTTYGTWTNEIENEKFRKEMERQMKETSDSTGHDWVVNDIPENE